MILIFKHPVWMLYGCCAISRYNEDDTGWSLGLIPTYMGFLLSTINPVGSEKIPCLTYHPLCSLVETPDGDQVAATSPSLFPNLWSLIEKYSGKMKGSTEPRLLSLLQIS